MRFPFLIKFYSLLYLVMHMPLGYGNCVKVKAAFDIGSGSTKLKVAKVDTCKNKIKEFLHESSLPVPYKEDLRNKQGFSPAIQNAGIEALKKLKSQAKKFKPESYIGVATSAFRTAKNSDLFIKKIKEETQIKIIVIDQDLEAKLGYHAVLSQENIPVENLVVWDIGGGSMQISFVTPKNRFIIYQGKVASVTFKNFYLY